MIGASLRSAITLHRANGTPMLIAATTSPVTSRTGAAMDAMPISRSLIASAQPRWRTRASSATSCSREVIVCGVSAVSGAARSTACRLASGR